MASAVPMFFLYSTNLQILLFGYLDLLRLFPSGKFVSVERANKAVIFKHVVAAEQDC